MISLMDMDMGRGVVDVDGEGFRGFLEWYDILKGPCRYRRIWVQGLGVG